MNEIELQGLLNQARRLMEEEKLLHAAQLYHRLRILIPELEEPYLQLAMMYHSWHRDAEAQGVLREGMRASPGSDRCALLLGEFYMERRAFKEAVACLRLQRGKRHPLVYQSIATALLRQGKTSEAESEIRMSIRLDDRAPESHEVLGEILLQTRRTTEAITELNRAVRLNPYHGVTHRLLGTALLRQHRLNDALREFTLAADMDPGEPGAWQACGETLIRLRRFDEAERYFQKVLDLNPRSPDASVGLGEIALHRGETRNALVAFHRALHEHPGHQRALDGKLRARVGANRIARKAMLLPLLLILAFGQLAAQGPGADEFFRKGVSLYDEGRFSEAAAAFGEVFSRFPSAPQVSAATIMKAKALFFSGEIIESAKVARGFLSSAPGSIYVADAHHLLGAIYRRIGRSEDAMLEFALAWNAMPVPQPQRLLESLRGAVDTVAARELSLAALRSLVRASTNREYQSLVHLVIAEREGASENTKAARLALDTLLSLYPEVTGHPRVAFLLHRIEARSDVKIAALLPLMRKSEPSAGKEIGADIADGIQYAIERYGLDSHQRVRVTLLLKDTERDPQLAEREVRELAADPGLVAILGPVFSNTTLTAARAAEEVGVPLISPTANANGIAATGRHIFQTNPDYDTRGRAMARYAVLTRGFKNLAVLAPSDSYGKFLAQGFLDEAVKLGAQVLSTEWYVKGSTDFKKQLSAIRKAGLRAASEAFIAFGGRKKLGELIKLVGLGVSVRTLDSLMARGALVNVNTLLGPGALSRVDSLGIRVVYNDVLSDSLEVPVQKIDGIYLPISSAEEIGAVAPQVVYFNIQAQLLGSGEWNNISELDGSRRYCTGVVFESDSYAESTGGEYASWAAGFLSRFKRPPSKHALFGFDTAGLVLGALRDGATTREALVRMLSEVTDYRGLHSRIGFSRGRVNVWLPLLQFDGHNVVGVGEIRVE